jgi:hypothetical protein
VILSISPDSGATNVEIKEIEFKFDEVVSDRPAGSATELDQLFLISPRDGSANVSWHRSRITVRPRKGFRANTAYRVTLLPGLTDLRGNVLKEGTSILFSTGPTFPPYGILGRVFDWTAQRPVSGAYVEAVSIADTTLAYIGATDTSGTYDLSPMPPGRYLLRAMVDQNANRAIDPREKWDSATVEITSVRPSVELDLIERDSTPPAITGVTATDSVTLRLSFDKAIDPRTRLEPSLFRIQRADSTVVQIAGVQWAIAYQAAVSRRDSIERAARDSVARARDTTRRAAPPAPAAPAAPAAPPATGQRPAPPPPKPKSPPPDNGIVLSISPATPLTPGRYVLFAHGLPNLVGHTSEVRRGFIISAPARDTTKRTPADTTRPPARPPHR